MYAIDVLKEEHENILRLTRVIRTISLHMFAGGEPPTEDIRDIIKFIRDYADGEHHAKEENLLFKAMLEHIPGDLAKALVGHGMVAEHDQARYTVMSLETVNNRYVITPTDELRLDIVVYLMDYANLLESHAKKENTVAYPFGVRELPDDILKRIDDDTKSHLESNKNRARRDSSLAILDRLEKTWLTDPSENA